MIRIQMSAGAIRTAALALLAATLLGACSDEQQEVRAWMEDQRKHTPTIKDKIAPPKSFEPFRYEALDQSDPFSQTRLSARGGMVAPASTITPDLKRRREALEEYPLDAIRMVGHMSNGRSSFALLQVDSMVYQARVGNYAGQNFGLITRVTDTEIKLKELVQDAAGDWVERESALRLQESKK